MSGAFAFEAFHQLCLVCYRGPAGRAETACEPFNACRAELSEEDVAADIAERAAARAAKDFAAADAVRLRLAERGVLLMDTPGGTAWRPGVLDQAGL